MKSVLQKQAIERIKIKLGFRSGWGTCGQLLPIEKSEEEQWTAAINQT